MYKAHIKNMQTRERKPQKIEFLISNLPSTSTGKQLEQGMDEKTWSGALMAKEGEERVEGNDHFLSRDF